MADKMNIADMASCAIEFLTAPSKKGIIDFALNNLMPDGGFRGRAGQSDLYYTFFGVQLLSILSKEALPEEVYKYLEAVKEPEKFDLIHLICYLRTENFLKTKAQSSNDIAGPVEGFRVAGRGYCIENSHEKKVQSSSIYASFLAYSTYRECSIDLTKSAIDTAGIVECIGSLKSADGSYAEVAGMESGTLTVTGAAVMLLYDITGRVDDAAVAWIIDRQAKTGGFYASKDAFLPDLVSSAAAVFCLNLVNQKHNINKNILDFVESLMQADSGFGGNNQDFTPDVEYTFYGLLVIGSFMF